MDKNLQNFIELDFFLKDQTTMPKDLADWLSNAMHVLATGRVKTLDEAFQVQGLPGSGLVGTRLQRFYRDMYLRQLLSALNASGSSWGAAKKCRDELENFPRKKLRISNKKKSELSKKEVLLLKIFEADPNVPRSIGFLYSLQKTPHVYY